MIVKKNDGRKETLLPASLSAGILSYVGITGLIGLIAEICWIKRSTLIFGASIQAMSAIIAMFFIGITIGNAFFGKKSARTKIPLQWYAYCELAAGFFIAISPLSFYIVSEIYSKLYPFVSSYSSMLLIFKIISIGIVLLPPTVCMGGSLPLVNRFFIRSNASITPSISIIYAINTIGAVIGAFFAGFILIPMLGIQWTLICVGAINIMIAGLFISYMHFHKTIFTIAPIDENSIKIIPPVEKEHAPKLSWVMGVLFFIMGGAALGNELIWTRYLSLILHNTVYTYTITLGIILFGIACGSLLVRIFSQLLDQKSLWIYSLVTLLCGFSLLTLLWISPHAWIRIIDTQKTSTIVRMALLIMLLPSVLSGIAFPIGLRAIIQNYKNASSVVGSLTALNILGSVLGTLLFGFLLLPAFGLQRTIFLNASIFFISSTIALFLIPSVKKKSYLWLFSGCAAILLWLSYSMAPVQIPRDYLKIQGQLLDYQEGLHSIVSIVRNEYNAVVMEIDRLWQGSNQKTHQVMAAHIPALLHGSPRHIAVIGVGAGQTAQRFLLYPTTSRLDCIDIEKSIFTFIKRYFNGAWLDDTRVHTIADDGRDYITHTANKYDIISIEIGQLFRPSCAGFYSYEFYKSLKKALQTNGVVCQFVPLAFVNHTYFLRIIRTFVAVFPHSTLWYNGNELLLIGAREKKITFNVDTVASLLSRKAIHDDCFFSLWGGASQSFNKTETVLASFLCDSSSLSRITEGYNLLTDDRPDLEYATGKHQQYGIDEMDNYMDFLSKNCDPFETIAKTPLSDSLLQRCEFTRKYNLRNVPAIGYLKEYLNSGISDYLKQALALNPYNLDILVQCALYATKKNDLFEARQLYYKALSIDSTYSPAYNNLGTLEEKRGNLVEATRLFGQAIRCDSLNKVAYENIVNMYKRRGEADSAAYFSTIKK